MVKGIVIITGNGILTFPGAADNWTGKSTTNIMIDPEIDFAAEKFEYLAGAITRGIRQKRRAAKLIKTISFWRDAGWKIILFGHSNFANVIINALKELPDAKDYIIALVLISPACPADFDKNGFNDAGIQVYLYIAGKDRPLWWASGPGKLLGYGSFGKDGPKNNAMIVWVHREPTYGHSTWFDDENFEKTMALVKGNFFTAINK